MASKSKGDKQQDQQQVGDAPATNEQMEGVRQQANGAGRKKEDDDVPAGFDQRVGREQGDGWLKKTVGQVIQGRLLGLFTMRGESNKNDDGTYRRFFQVKVHKDSYYLDSESGEQVSGVLANWTNPEDKEDRREVTLTHGQIVNIDAHKALEDLEPYVNNGGVYDVWVKYVSEDPLPGRGNKTFWRVKGPHLKTLRPASRPNVVPGQPQANPQNMDDIPF